MKTVVFDQNVFELEVKPHGMLDKYQRLLEKDVKERLMIPDKLISYPCPGCLSEKFSKAFEKFSCAYLLCDRCKSLYVSPRPSEELLIDFYRNSGSSRFWFEQILANTRETRRTKLFIPRAEWLLDVFDAYCSDAKLGIVVGYHNDLLIEELFHMEKELFNLIITNPIADIEFSRPISPKVTIRPTPFNKLASLGRADIFLAFDILDRCADIEQLFAAARASLVSGGLLLAITSLISGFDLQILWDRSDSIYPPERLNLFSVEGLTMLFERHGFEIIEFSTPGMFDVENVRRAIHSAPDHEWPRFIRYLVEKRDEKALWEFQEYLQKYRLSSFGRIVLRKAE